MIKELGQQGTVWKNKCFAPFEAFRKSRKPIGKPIIQIPPKHSKRSKIHCDSTHLPLLWQPPWPVQPFARPFGADVVAPPPASPHPGRAQPRRCRSPRRPQRRAVTEGHGLRTRRPRRCRRDGQERTPWKQQLQPRVFRKIVCCVVVWYNLKFHLLQLGGWEGWSTSREDRIVFSSLHSSCCPDSARISQSSIAFQPPASHCPEWTTINIGGLEHHMAYHSLKPLQLEHVKPIFCPFHNNSTCPPKRSHHWTDCEASRLWWQPMHLRQIAVNQGLSNPFTAIVGLADLWCFFTGAVTSFSQPIFEHENSIDMGKRYPPGN